MYWLLVIVVLVIVFIYYRMRKRRNYTKVNERIEWKKKCKNTSNREPDWMKTGTPTQPVPRLTPERADD